MVHLTLAGVSGDGKRLLLVSDAGVEFTLDIDARLRAALRGEHASIGQLEINMESALRPRDIQARIRAGDTPEEVAQAAQTTVERILPYANPVLAERAHVADRAQRSSLRRRAGESGARTLGEAVELHLTSNGISPDMVSWDAWRREDGRWVLTAEYAAGTHRGTGRFTFDAPGNYVIAEDADARWLVGEAPETPAARSADPAPRDDLERARARRRAVVPPEQLTLGDDAIDLVTERAPGEGATGDVATETPVEAYLDEEGPTTDLPVVEEPPGATTAPESQAEPEPEAEPEAEQKPTPQKRPRKRGRASVPSWDEIMFGGGKSD